VNDPFEGIAKVRFDEGHRELARRIRTEGKIFRKTVTEAIAAGYTVSLCDGEEWTVKKSTDKTALIEAAFSTDEDILKLRKADGSSIGNIMFIYGNDGYDVISDYTASDEMEAFYQAKLSPYIEKLETGE